MARTAIVALQAEQLRFIEAGLAMPESGNDETPQMRHLHELAREGRLALQQDQPWLNIELRPVG